jgi:hypothetical protein
MRYDKITFKPSGYFFFGFFVVFFLGALVLQPQALHINGHLFSK